MFPQIGQNIIWVLWTNTGVLHVCDENYSYLVFLWYSLKNIEAYDFGVPLPPKSSLRVLHDSSFLDYPYPIVHQLFRRVGGGGGGTEYHIRLRCEHRIYGSLLETLLLKVPESRFCGRATSSCYLVREAQIHSVVPGRLLTVDFNP